jgi:hypothetical protein
VYSWVLIAHSAWRWAVLLAGCSAVLGATLITPRQPNWATAGPGLNWLFVMALDVQILLGAVLYLLSPFTTIIPTTAPSLSLSPQFDYFATFHPASMVAAFVMAHLGAVLIRRGRSEVERRRRAIFFHGLTLMIVIYAIPWWRPWWRL